MSQDLNLALFNVRCEAEGSTRGSFLAKYDIQYSDSSRFDIVLTQKQALGLIELLKDRWMPAQE